MTDTRHKSLSLEKHTSTYNRILFLILQYLGYIGSVCAVRTWSGPLDRPSV
ncbi:uncharacterized protein RHIMIDRAFT_267645, partial [Rhizopus microsporus ATCC 52813]